MPFTWTAIYTDNTTLSQINPDGSKNAYFDIDRNRLKRFDLIDSDRTVLSMPFQPNERLIWRRRVEMSPGGVVEACHIVGKQSTVAGENKQLVFAVFESDGHIESATEFKQNHPWLYAPQLDSRERLSNG